MHQVIDDDNESVVMKEENWARRNDRLYLGTNLDLGHVTLFL